MYSFQFVDVFLLLPQHEMDHKETFIRYVSHEIRSPLSSTSLGLDHLINQLKSGALTTIADILEIAIEAKISCDLATGTVNDLLMFDKMESGMMELARVDCDAWEFIQSCVKPFNLQVCAYLAQ